MDWERFYNSFREPDFVPGYEILNRLGGGAFGDVYKARKSSIGKAYAIKFLKVEDESQRGAIERELEQVRHFAAIDHPNLVTIEDMGIVLGVPYLIMGYAGEDTLARRLRRGTPSPREALSLFVQTCRGVLALHDRRLVHFDLKPSNVFIKDDVARVGDYGLAKLMSDGCQTLSFGRGTPFYMAPEMLRNRADHRADVYSLGVMLFESLTGALPYEPPPGGGVLVREDDAPPAFPPDFPLRLRPVVERCLRLEPEHRFAGVNELLESLGQAARPGDSIVLDALEVPAGSGPRGAPSPAGARGEPSPPEAAPSPAGEARAGDAATPLRSTAAELVRGAVEVARGVVDGLRQPRGEAGPAGGNGRAEEPAGDVAAVGTLEATPVDPGAAPRRRRVDRAHARDEHARTALARGTRPAPTRTPPVEAPDALAARPWPGNGAALETGAGRARAGTVPVPPRAEGGPIGTLLASIALGVEVMVALLTGPVRAALSSVGRAGDRVLRGFPRLLAGTLKLVLFFVFLMAAGAALTVVFVRLVLGIPVDPF